MNRLDRLFGLVTLLQARRYVPAERLAAHFGISLRTVYRDLRALGEWGIPVSFESGRGYSLVPGYFLPPVSFTSGEASALLLLETLGATLADRSVQPLVAAALQKVRAVLRPPDQARLAQLADSIQLAGPEYREHPKPPLAPLQRAIAGRQVLELAYRDKEGHGTASGPSGWCVTTSPGTWWAGASCGRRTGSFGWRGCSSSRPLRRHSPMKRRFRSPIISLA